jgi:hypothetical protein
MRGIDKKFEKKIILVLIVWFAGVAVLTYAQILKLMPTIAFGVLVAGTIIGLLILYFKSRKLRDYISSLSYKNLTLLNIWRIPAGLMFLYYGSQNWLPETFVFNAGYGDILVGLITPLILFLPESVSKYVAFHVFGLLDFMIAVGTGITMTILQVPLMENIAGFPIALIPLFGVPITGLLHVAVLNRLQNERKKNLIEVKA